MYIARQPIFDRSVNLFAYELLYRDSVKAATYSEVNPMVSTATVVSGLLEIDVIQLIEAKLAFVNVDEKFLLHESIELLNPRMVIIELLESIVYSDFVIDRIDFLKRKGFRFALDDFDHRSHNAYVLSQVEFIKYDILSTPLDTISDSVAIAKTLKKKIVAEKVETYDVFLEAKAIGFDFFQGFFFAKPRVVGEIPKMSASYQTYLQLLSEIHTSEPSIPKMASIIEKDVKIAYRLLRLIGNKKLSNQSIISAILHIGLEAMQRWLYLLLLQDSALEKPDELLRLSLQRSRFAELLSQNSKFKYRSSDVALMCLLSVIDTMMSTTMERALQPLGIDEQIKEAMIHHRGPYSCIYALVCLYEQLDNERIMRYCNEVGVNCMLITDYYVMSIRFSNDICKRIASFR